MKVVFSIDRGADATGDGVAQDAGTPPAEVLEGLYPFG